MGGSKELIEQILNDPSLESFPADPNDPYDGFYVNNTAVANDDEYVPPRNYFRNFLRHNLFRFRNKPGSGAILYRKKRWWEWWLGP